MFEFIKKRAIRPVRDTAILAIWAFAIAVIAIIVAVAHAR